LLFALSFVILHIVGSGCCKTCGNKTPLFVYVKPEQLPPHGQKYEFKRGVPLRVVFTVRNETDDFIILRRFDIENQLGDIDRWYGSAYGSTEYRHLEDVWEYNEMNQQLSEPVFIRGLIAPGEKLEIVRNVIFRDQNMRSGVSYQRLTKKQLAKEVYFDTQPGSGFDRTFKLIKNIDILLADRGAVDWSFAVFPNADEFVIDKQQSICSVDLAEPEFSFEVAKNKLSQDVSDFVFWKDKNTWVLKTDQGNYLVDENGVVKLGDIDLLAFVLIEFGADKVDFILPMKGYRQFDAQQPKIDGPGYFDPGVTSVPKEKITDLLKYAAGKGDRVSVLVYDPTGLGRKFYLLVGQFDEKSRRTVANEQ
jgi:hypothetical protein